MAANDEIKINRGATTDAANLGAARDALRNAANVILQEWGALQHMTDGTTFTALETNCGLQAGQGTVVYSAFQQVAILFGAQNTIDANIDKLINRLQ
jgi:hypothetical protein